MDDFLAEADAAVADLKRQRREDGHAYLYGAGNPAKAPHVGEGRRRQGRVRY